MNIVNVGYRSTNYYVLGAGPGRLMVDGGWPGTLPQLLHALSRAGIAVEEIGYLLATHYHPDHAGLAEELKRRGARLLVLESQREAWPQLATLVKPTDGFTPITAAGNLALTFAGSRAFLAGIGIAGEIIPTPGHSDDSVSLVLDSGAAFTGDLTPFATGSELCAASWRRLRELGATTIYPGHGPAGPLPEEASL